MKFSSVSGCDIFLGKQFSWQLLCLVTLVANKKTFDEHSIWHDFYIWILFDNSKTIRISRKSATNKILT